MPVDDVQHVAFPKLFGAPAYARPPTVADCAARPFDPDDLPILAELTAEERSHLTPAELALLIGSFDADGAGSRRTGLAPSGIPAVLGARKSLREVGRGAVGARPFALRALADRLRGRG